MEKSKFSNPMLCIGSDDESVRAKEILDNAGIDYDLWDVTIKPPLDRKPPFVSRGRNTYVGVKQIEEFVEIYPGILKAEEGYLNRKRMRTT